MKISVIIPAYNCASSIERCLDSVKNQTLQTVDYEILVINDGSNDTTQTVVEDYMDRHMMLNIQLINKENGGVSSARNEGLRRATGDYIALLDSDDEWLPTKIAKQIDFFSKNPEIDFLGCNVTTWAASIFGRRISKPSKIKLWEQFISWYPSTPTVIFKSNVIQDVGFYDQNLSHGEDGQFLARILMKKNCWFIPDELVIIGGGKPTFGHSGLSANLVAMKNGQKKILYYVFMNNSINCFQYIFFYSYLFLKHWRRVVITKLRTK